MNKRVKFKKIAPDQWECKMGMMDFVVSKEEEGFVVDIFKYSIKHINHLGVGENDKVHVESFECSTFAEAQEEIENWK